MYFILIKDMENRPADVLATIIGMTLKYMEYTRPITLANKFIHKKV
jgi:hypothetical protein